MWIGCGVGRIRREYEKDERSTPSVVNWVWSGQNTAWIWKGRKKHAVCVSKCWPFTNNETCYKYKHKEINVMWLTHLVNHGCHAESDTYKQHAHQQQQTCRGDDGPAGSFRQILGLQPTPSSPHSPITVGLFLSSLLTFTLPLSLSQRPSTDPNVFNVRQFIQMTFQFFLLIVLILVLGSFHVEGDIIGIVAASYQDLSDKQPVSDIPYHAKFIKMILRGYLKNKIQLDATYYFIMLILGSLCFGHHYAHHQELTTIALVTT